MKHIYLKSVLISLSIISLATANAQTLSDYSALPETTTLSPDQTPNILFVFDISGSMLRDNAGNSVGGHSPDSRSYQMRLAMRNLISANVGNFNVGLMTFGSTQLNSATQSHAVSDCKDYPGCGTNPDFGYRIMTGGGALVENVEPLTQAHADKLNLLLATEPLRPTVTTSPTPYDSLRGHFPAGENLTHNGTLTSTGSTPTNGTMISATTYLLGETLPNPTSLTLDEIGGNIASLADVQTLAFSSDVKPECRPNTFVFLVTDGLPTMSTTGGTGNNSTPAIETPLVAATAAALLGYEVETWVFGYGLPAIAEADMNIIARAGSGNTRDAFMSDSTDILQAQIEAALQEIQLDAGSASGISVIASTSDTAGSVVQAIYKPDIKGTVTTPVTDGAGNTTNQDVEVEVNWTSTLSAYFLDEFGYLREDSKTSGTQGKLDDGYAIDRAFTLALEPVDLDGDGKQDTQEVRATRLTIQNVGGGDTFSETANGTSVPLDDLDSIWEAGKILSKHYNGASGAARSAVAEGYAGKNRLYNQPASAASGYRRIYSWIQNDASAANFIGAGGAKFEGTQIDFLYNDSISSNAINPKNYTLLGINPVSNDSTAQAEAQAQAENIVRFIRGDETIDGFRNRSIGDKAFLLGDIVHSTAAQVDIPNNIFNTQFGDSSYTAFREAYSNRRRMVYVGGNDGLLHAFNGGFWDGETATLNITSPDGSDDVAHELGAEVWAYAPMNLLPHLQWLTRTDYDTSVHVAYMDGPVKVFDVQAFPSDDVHINGWGTILVASMRLGGGDYPAVDPDATSSTNSNFTARSAYVLIDVTDPTQEPVVIGEITHPNLGFTTSEPTVMKEGDNWYLMFGSGPNSLATVTAQAKVTNTIPPVAVPQRPHLYRYLLNHDARGFASDGDGENDFIGTDNGFVGNLIAHDWDSDYNHDAVYFGLITGNEADPSGGLYRYVGAAERSMNSSKVDALLDIGQPVPYAPLLKSYLGKNWVMFGSGRYFTAQDAQNDDQNSFYGVMEPRNIDNLDYPTLATTSTSILDVSNITVTAPSLDANGNLTVDANGTATEKGGGLSSAVNGQTTFNELRNNILSDTAVNGWKYNYAPQLPSTKTSASPLSFRNLLFYTFYEPILEDNNQCSNEFGESSLRAVDLVTGLPSFTERFAGPLGTENNNIQSTVSLGDGYAFQSYLFIGPDPATGKARVTIKAPLSTGVLKDVVIEIPPSPNGRTSWRELEAQ